MPKLPQQNHNNTYNTSPTILNEIRNIKASLWISASAGTGKTKNLIDRILVLLLNNVVPSKILCLTYTNVASSEMLNRLSQYLKKLYLMSNIELKNELILLGFDESFINIAKSLYEKSMNSVEWVQIQTIHSFCLSILKKFPLETGIFPGVQLCDDYQKKLLIDETLRFTLSDPSLHKYFKCIARYNIELHEIIEKQYTQVSEFLSKFNEFEKLYSTYFDVDTNMLFISDEELDNYLFNKIFSGKHTDTFLELSKILYKGNPSDIKTADILSGNHKNPSSNFLKAFLTQDNNIKSCLYTKPLSKYTEFVEKITKTAQHALEFYRQKNNALSATANIAIFVILKSIIHNFNELKRKKHLIDFNDIISMTLSLLNNIEWVMYKIDGGLEHILIDEAQDTTQEQWEIIKIITDEFFTNQNSEKTVFVVGDGKQSIYSFQGANIRLFHEMHNYFKSRSERNGQKFYDIILNKSYRSTGKILEFVDDIFQKSFQNIKHITSRSQNAGVIELIELFKNDDKEQLAAWEIQQDLKKLQTSEQKLALYIAHFIASTIDSGVFVESKNRSAQPSDFLILFQRRNLQTMKNVIYALKKANIPVANIDKISLKDELIVQDLIVFAEFAIFPLDDLACACVLKSPIIGITENELMQLCLNRGEQHLWSYILLNQNFCEKYSIKEIENIINDACLTSAYEFFMKAINSGLKEKFISRLGIKCLDILSEFMDLIMVYSEENTASIQSFIEWFKSFDHKIKSESLSNENAVKIMTAHAAKGLQSPFVILADTHFVSTKKEKLFETQEGILLWDFSTNNRSQKITALLANYAHLNNEESKRLLYVALTRAEDFLYIIGEQKKNNENCWYNFINKNIDYKKFQKISIDNHEILRYGEYKKIHTPYETDTKSQNTPTTPNWFFKKIDTVTPQSDNIKTVQMLYGDCVHILLNEMPKYKQYFSKHPHNPKYYNFSFDIFADSLLANIDLPTTEKNTAKLESYTVLMTEKLDFIFNDTSLSEVTFIKDGQEKRIDKIAFCNNEIWVIDFKTGTPQKIIPNTYIKQLSEYKTAILEIRNSAKLPSNIINKKHTTIKTAILWTQNATLIEIT